MNFIEEKVGTTLTVIKNISTVKRLPIQNIRYCSTGYKTQNSPPDNADWQDYEVKTIRTKPEEHFWFVFTVEIPKLREDEAAYLKVTTNNFGWDAHNPQGTVFVDGTTALQGFDVNHLEMPIKSGVHNINLYMYGNTGPTNMRFETEIIIKNTEIEKLYYDMYVPLLALGQMDKNSYNYTVTLNALDRACLLLDLRNPDSHSILPSVRAAIRFLEEEYYQKYCGRETEGELALIGHTHIDVAWLWTLAQTAEKAQRSFATVISLMEQYPDYIFMSSQPQLYEYVKENDPELYEKIKARIKEGRWEAEGAMWLEPDTNIPSGESLIRQIMYGKRFMREEFVVDNKILWLPDVFGYSAALPQIMKKCGVDTFFTTKLCWNETNQFPYDNFVWEGLDGSQVFAVLTDSYSKDLTPELVISSMKKHKNKKHSTAHPCTVGFADGGGGTTAVMMEMYERLKKGLPGFPKVTMRRVGDSLEEIKTQFFKNAAELKDMPKWVGELYLEMHRGTYTTMAENKLNNRKSEFVYGAAESLSVIAEKLVGLEYPIKSFEENWHTILKNQFHDIIPGSSVKAVYDDSRLEYEKVLGVGNGIYDAAFDCISDNITTDGGYIVFNPSSFARSEIVECDGNTFMVSDIPPLGYAVVKPEIPHSIVKAEDKRLENECLIVGFDDDYHIISIYDKENNREIIPEGCVANVFEVFEDYPREFDAWEITEYYQQKNWIADDVSGIEIINRPLYAAIRIKRKYNRSSFSQEIRLNAQSKRLDFITDIDWHEDHSLLKTAFPLAIHTNVATCDVQFGFIERPTFLNNPWDKAKFEFCAHKFVDMSEGDYGVALLNDCKYGYSAKDNVLKLSLLKAPTYPNPEADRGKHHFVYSIYPHNNGFASSDVVKQGYIMNRPMKIKRLAKHTVGALPERFSLVSTDKNNVVIETVKKAEDGNGIIVRIFDAENKRGKVALEFGFPVLKAYICDMLENCEEEIKVSSNSLTVDFTNFEIKTLRVLF